MNQKNPPPSKPNLSPSSLIRTTILGVPLDICSRSEALARSESLLNADAPHQIVTLNALMVLESEKSKELLAACQEAALLFADSSGITWAATILNKSGPERYPGIDLAFDLCRVCRDKGWSIYLLGGSVDVAESAARDLTRRLPGLLIAGTSSGFFNSSDEPTLIQKIKSSNARLILVGLGMPKQEVWIHKNLPYFPPGVVMGVGGSLDVWAGRVRRAPAIYQTLGLEWLYRSIQEPYRWARIAQLPKFALKIAVERMSAEH